mmetsp:Transcript_9263/g.22948  ORF Transcript_9263/g.22948 Transcript_9263/m.22948 type:complete len:185 (-) Transcript_9263:42-596(-)
MSVNNFSDECTAHAPATDRYLQQPCNPTALNHVHPARTMAANSSQPSSISQLQPANNEIINAPTVSTASESVAGQAKSYSVLLTTKACSRRRLCQMALHRSGQAPGTTTTHQQAFVHHSARHVRCHASTLPVAWPRVLDQCVPPDRHTPHLGGGEAAAQPRARLQHPCKHSVLPGLQNSLASPP